MNIAIEKIDTNIETNQIKELDTHQEILENLNQEVIFKLQWEKQTNKKLDTEQEKKEALALATKREMKIMSDIKEMANKEEIDSKIAKKIIRVGIEIIRNISCYSIDNKAIIFQIIKSKNKKSNENSYKIITRNYYEDETWEKTADLERRLEEWNNLDLDILKEKQQQQLRNENYNEYNNAGIWYMQIARWLRKENLEPFQYKFIKQKDWTIRFDLILKIS